MIQISAHGRLTKDTNIIITRNNKDMCSASLACDATPFKAKGQHTIYYNLIAFNLLAKALANHQRGDLISISGKASLSVWLDDKGVKHERHQILIDSLISSKTAQPTRSC